VFEIPAIGSEQVYYNFCSRNNSADGAYTAAGFLAWRGGGALVSTTIAGGLRDCPDVDDVLYCGTVFQIGDPTLTGGKSTKK
jgi:hypothetical protein